MCVLRPSIYFFCIGLAVNFCGMYGDRRRVGLPTSRARARVRRLTPTDRYPRDSNPGPLDLKSSILPLSHRPPWERPLTEVVTPQGESHPTVHSAVSDAGMDGSQYSQYRGRPTRTAAPDLVPAGLPSCHSPSEAERCAYTPPSDRRPDPPPGGFRERTPPPDQLTYTPPAERCIFTLPSQPRSAAIKQLPTFGGRASPPPPPPPPPLLSPAGQPVEEEGLLV